MAALADVAHFSARSLTLCKSQRATLLLRVSSRGGGHPQLHLCTRFPVWRFRIEEQTRQAERGTPAHHPGRPSLAVRRLGAAAVGTFSFLNGLAGSHKFPSPSPLKAGILV